MLLWKCKTEFFWSVYHLVHLYLCLLHVRGRVKEKGCCCSDVSKLVIGLCLKMCSRRHVSLNTISGCKKSLKCQQMRLKVSPTVEDLFSPRYLNFWKSRKWKIVLWEESNYVNTDLFWKFLIEIKINLLRCLLFFYLCCKRFLRSGHWHVSRLPSDWLKGWSENTWL